MPWEESASAVRTLQPLEWPGLEAGGLTLSLARTADELAQLQRLRLRVFSADLGARFPDAQGDRDVDVFDAWCLHFMVRDKASGRVVGTYRLLTPEAAVAAGRYYADAEFDLAPLAPLRPRLVEVGRSCIAAGFRDGAAIMLLWSGLARIMTHGGYRYMLGCASVSVRDGAVTASEVWRRALALMERHPQAPVLRPWRPYPLSQLVRTEAARLPPLIKGYLKLGCTICGAPAWDPDFGTADFPVLLDLHTLDARYRRHFGMQPLTSPEG